MLVKFTDTLIDVRHKRPFKITEVAPDEFELDDKKRPIMVDGKKVPKTREVELTVRYVIGEACSYVHDDERNLAYEEKRKRAKMVERAYDNDEAQLTAEEIVMIKERVGKLYGGLVILALEKRLGEDHEEVQEHVGKKPGKKK